MSFIKPFNTKFNIGTAASSGGYDPDAQSWFDRMTSPTIKETDGLNAYVLGEKAVPNFSLLDYFACLGIGSTNSLIDVISKAGTANGGITFDETGADFNGTNGYIDTDYNPSVDNVNSSLDDAISGSFIVTNADVTVQAMWGCLAGGTNRTELVIKDINEFFYAINMVNDRSGAGLPDEDDKVYALVRDNSVDFDFYVDGVLDITIVQVSSALPNLNIALGARETGASRTIFWEGKMFSHIEAAAIGFDHGAHNTNIRALKTALA